MSAPQCRLLAVDARRHADINEGNLEWFACRPVLSDECYGIEALMYESCVDDLFALWRMCRSMDGIVAEQFGTKRFERRWRYSDSICFESRAISGVNRSFIIDNQYAHNHSPILRT